jgi:hypothetical protein
MLDKGYNLVIAGPNKSELIALRDRLDMRSSNSPHDRCVHVLQVETQHPFSAFRVVRKLQKLSVEDNVCPHSPIVATSHVSAVLQIDAVVIVSPEEKRDEASKCALYDMRVDTESSALFPANLVKLLLPGMKRRRASLDARQCGGANGHIMLVDARRAYTPDEGAWCRTAHSAFLRALGQVSAASHAVQYQRSPCFTRPA